MTATLRCTCGGMLEITYCTPTDRDVDRWTEKYECANCGSKGGGSFPANGRGSPDYWGCVDA